MNENRGDVQSANMRIMEQSEQAECFEIGKDSFGEVYHVALHGILLPETAKRIFCVHFQEPHASSMRELFNDLQIERALTCPGWSLKPRGLSETANTMLSRFHRNTVSGIATVVLELAKRKKWRFPFPELASPSPKILIWQRSEDYEPWRNSTPDLIRQLAQLAIGKGSTPVIVGPKIGIDGAREIGNFHENSFFSGDHNICKQLWFQHMLFEHFGVKASVGMMMGVLDGAAMFFGHKTVFFARGTDAKPRMAKVSIAIPALHWLQTEFDGFIGPLNERAIQDLTNIIWPNT